MNEGWATFANKTHLFNWLYNMTVQMAQRVGVCILNTCVRVMSTVFPFIHARVYVRESGPYLPSQLAA